MAERAFAADADAPALVLLTPVCSVAVMNSSPTAPAEVSATAVNYPSLATFTRPVVLIPGNADPLCAVQDLYAFLGDSSGNAAMVVVGGDHSWNVTTDTSVVGAARNGRSISEGVRIAAHWINLMLER